MSDVLYARPMEPPVTPEAVVEMGRQAGGCFGLHRVAWRYSFLAEDGGRMICWYRAGDAESVRLALRQLGSDLAAVWPATVVDGTGDEDLDGPCVMAELEAGEDGDAARAAQTAQHLVDAQGHPLTALLGFVGTGGRRMAWVYRGASADAVAAALEAGNLAPVRVWACLPLRPAAGAA